MSAQTKRDSGELVKGSVVKEVLSEAERLEVKEKVPLVLAELLLTDNILAEVKKFRTIFLGVSFHLLALSCLFSSSLANQR